MSNPMTYLYGTCNSTCYFIMVLQVV